MSEYLDSTYMRAVINTLHYSDFWCKSGQYNLSVQNLIGAVKENTVAIQKLHNHMNFMREVVKEHVVLLHLAISFDHPLYYSGGEYAHDQHELYKTLTKQRLALLEKLHFDKHRDLVKQYLDMLDTLQSRHHPPSNANNECSREPEGNSTSFTQKANFDHINSLQDCVARCSGKRPAQRKILPKPKRTAQNPPQHQVPTPDSHQPAYRYDLPAYHDLIKIPTLPDPPVQNMASHHPITPSQPVPSLFKIPSCIPSHSVPTSQSMMGRVANPASAYQPKVRRTNGGASVVPGPQAVLLKDLPEHNDARLIVNIPEEPIPLPAAVTKKRKTRKRKLKNQISLQQDSYPMHGTLAPANQNITTSSAPKTGIPKPASFSSDFRENLNLKSKKLEMANNTTKVAQTAEVTQQNPSELPKAIDPMKISKFDSSASSVIVFKRDLAKSTENGIQKSARDEIPRKIKTEVHREDMVASASLQETGSRPKCDQDPNNVCNSESGGTKTIEENVSNILLSFQKEKEKLNNNGQVCANLGHVIEPEPMSNILLSFQKEKEKLNNCGQVSANLGHVIEPEPVVLPCAEDAYSVKQEPNDRDSDTESAISESVDSFEALSNAFKEVPDVYFNNCAPAELTSASQSHYSEELCQSSARPSLCEICRIEMRDFETMDLAVVSNSKCFITGGLISISMEKINLPLLSDQLNCAKCTQHGNDCTCFSGVKVVLNFEPGSEDGSSVAETGDFSSRSDFYHFEFHYSSVDKHFPCGCRCDIIATVYSLWLHFRVANANPVSPDLVICNQNKFMTVVESCLRMKVLGYSGGENNKVSFVKMSSDEFSVNLLQDSVFKAISFHMETTNTDSE